MKLFTNVKRLGVLLFNLFDLFGRKKDKPTQKDEGTEFSFIWYRKMQNNNTVHYTAPFRTKIRAKTREQAIEKMRNFAMQKLELIIIEEKYFDGDDLMKCQKSFNTINEQFEDLLNKVKNTISKIK